METSKELDIKRYILIGCGGLLINLMYVLVTVPYGIINGGVTSMSMILSRLPGTCLLSVGAWVAIVTGILLLLCGLFLGKENFLGSIFSCICCVGGFNLFTVIVPQKVADFIQAFGAIGANPVVPLGTLIELIICAIFVGYGYYLCISNNATAVGMDTIALILHKKNEKIPVAWAMYTINVIVLLLGLATYGLICVLMGIAFAGVQAASLHFFLKAGERAKAGQGADQTAIDRNGRDAV